MLFAMQIGIASTTVTEENSEKSEIKDQQQQTGQQPGLEEKLDEEPVYDETPEVYQDSLEDDSVNKYNFIFYFLYKFKYDHEEVTI